MIEILLAQLQTFGGPVLLALLAISVVATTTSIYKSLQFARIGVGRHRRQRQAMARWAAGDHDAALQLAASDPSPLAGVTATAMHALLTRPDNPILAREAAANRALDSLSVMGRHLRIVEAVVQAAPMLGLLGTVIGMIEAFGKVSEGGGAADPSALAGGIWVALTTTALGLAIAIPFYFISMWFESRVDRERDAMDRAISELTLGY